MANPFEAPETPAERTVSQNPATTAAKEVPAPVQRVVSEKRRAENPEPWIDEEREAAYEEQLSMLNGMEGVEDHQRFFGEVINRLLDFQGRPSLTEEEIKKLQVHEVRSDSASEITGKEILRPVIIIEDLAILEKISRGLDGGVERTGAAAGMNLPKRLFSFLRGLPNFALFEKTGVILAQNRPLTIGHEIRHTVDPHERDGADRVVEEMFAYYQECVVEGGEDWEKMIFFVGHPDYYARYVRQTDLSLDDFQKRVKAAVEHLKDMRMKQGHIVAQRRLVQCKTLDQWLMAKI